MPIQFIAIDAIRRTNTEQVLQDVFDGSREDFAHALDVSTAFLGRILNAGASQPRNIGDELARRIETVSGKPDYWLDQDHTRLNEASSDLLARYQASDPDVRAAINLLLDHPDVPIPEEIRPSLRAMIEMVRTAIKPHLKP